MANTNDNNFDMSVELKRGDAKIQITGRRKLYRRASHKIAKK